METSNSLSAKEERPDVLLWLDHESDFRDLALSSKPPLERYKLAVKFIEDVSAMHSYMDALPDSTLNELLSLSFRITRELAGDEVMSFLASDGSRTERLLDGSPEPDLHLLEAM